ncbi:alpha/beta hydrolase family protein [Alteribacillus iranensis]|uniref:Dienelactone hydrolase family protein n=1 Tax=Alteribacillus iranensis TaxID=930128 RepID=A0A1I2AG72_9BACI|nr:alpha/beta fold hydrolase [Alteribacillus iranensis]SFE43005.1 Dienelactone hydrolase family protein [Alteribacillus iranensis]
MNTVTKQESFVIPMEQNLYVRGNVHLNDTKEKKPVVILCHGFKGHKDWGFFPYVADYLADKGYVAIRFNFSCNGVKETDFDELDKFAINSFSRELKDIKTLFAAMTDRKLPYHDVFDLDKIALLGHSRGGGTSILHAADNTGIKAVITWNGIWNVHYLGDDVKKEAYEQGTAYIKNARTNQWMPISKSFFDDIESNGKKYDILNALTSMTTPLLLVQGEKDREWLVEGSKKMSETNEQHKRVLISGGNHTFQAVHPFQGVTPELEEALRHTTAFLKETLK